MQRNNFVINYKIIYVLLWFAFHGLNTCVTLTKNYYLLFYFLPTKADFYEEISSF